jgi:hypothetical protein
MGGGGRKSCWCDDKALQMYNVLEYIPVTEAAILSLHASAFLATLIYQIEYTSLSVVLSFNVDGRTEGNMWNSDVCSFLPSTLAQAVTLLACIPELARFESRLGHYLGRLFVFCLNACRQIPGQCVIKSDHNTCFPHFFPVHYSLFSALVHEPN